MNLFKNYRVFGLSALSMLMFISCHASQISMRHSVQEKMHVRCIDSKKIKEHAQRVSHAQKRYRYIKPVLTGCGVTLVVAYFWYTSSKLSSEEIDAIKKHLNLVNEKKTVDVDSSWLDWSKSSVSSTSRVAVELIGGALIIPPLSELIGKLTGCAHVMSSLELYDKEYTHCNALITQIARDMQMNLASLSVGKPAAIDVAEVVNASNRLVRRLEKLLGFMRVSVSKFSNKSLRQEAQAIEKRFIFYTNQLCNDMQRLIENSVLDSAVVLEIIVQFAQQYAQEMQRFCFLEQDAWGVV